MVMTLLWWSYVIVDCGLGGLSVLAHLCVSLVILFVYLVWLFSAFCWVAGPYALIIPFTPAGYDEDEEWTRQKEEWRRQEAGLPHRSAKPEEEMDPVCQWFLMLALTILSVPVHFGAEYLLTLLLGPLDRG